MFFRHYPGILLSALMLIAAILADGAVAAETPTAQYLLFQIFLGGPDPRNGAYHRGTSKDDMLRIARQITELVRPAAANRERMLGFAIGPIAMDQGEDGARAAIRDAFDVALTTGMAVALHLDDYMFWGQARWPDGRLLGTAQGTAEWKD